MSSMPQPLRTAIVGAGHRAVGYARYALDHPERMQITAVVDPDPARRAAAAARFAVPEDSCFASVGDLVARSPRPADAAINGTMDALHVPTTIPLLEAGYDVLLEKPFAVSEEEVARLAGAARRTGCKVLVCHVLRHAPFYSEIRKRLHAGILGRIFNIQLREHVSFHHFVVGFENGSTATLNIVGGSAAPQRAVHIVGEKGEIFGNFEDARFTIRLINQQPDSDYDDEVVDAAASAGMDTTGVSGGHGGGDGRLVADFVRVVRGEAPSLSTTSLDDSIAGHLAGFAADRAALENRVVELPAAGPGSSPSSADPVSHPATAAP